MSENGISGVAVAFSCAGAVLAYSAVKGTPIGATLRGLMSNQLPTAAAGTPASGASNIAGNIGNDASIGVPITGGMSEKQATVINTASKYLGVPYQWAGASMSGIDCSGLVMKAYESIGIQLAHYTVAMYADPRGKAVQSVGFALPADVIFFNNLEHCGLWLGNNQYMEAPYTGADVRISTLKRTDITGIRRFING